MKKKLSNKPANVYQRQWRANNKERYMKWRKHYQEENGERLNAKMHKYFKDNPDKYEQQQELCKQRYREIRKIYNDSVKGTGMEIKIRNK